MASLLRLSRTAPRAALRPAQRSMWGASPEPVAADLLVALDVESPVPLFDGPTPTKVRPPLPRPPPPRPPPTRPPPTRPAPLARPQVTTLENGLRVASSDMSLPSTTVGVFVDAGSRDEHAPGTCHMLQHLAFKSSTSRSQLMMARDSEGMGAQLSATASRESIVYQVDTLKSSVGEAVEMLAETTLSPKLLPWEMEQVSAAVKADVESLEHNPEALVQELAHPAAYGSSSPLGKPLYAKPNALGHLTGDDGVAFVGDFISSNFTPGRMVLAAAGYDHDELVALGKKYFGAAPKGERPNRLWNRRVTTIPP